jgi:arabinose-5-phosphate isomerase
MTVEDVFSTANPPVVGLNDKVRDVIVEISSKRLGATAVVDADGNLLGIITDGDLRRMLQRNESVENLKASDIMSVNPKNIEKNELAINAFNLMEANKITQLIVVDSGKYVGMVHIHDILREGIV